MPRGVQVPILPGSWLVMEYSFADINKIDVPYDQQLDSQSIWHQL